MKPFLKWAGGKTRLLKAIEMHLPAHFAEWENAIYVEPFVGGGAVLFRLLDKYKNIQRAIINDINQTLIDVYRTVQRDPSTLISMTTELGKQYLSCGNPIERSEFYYKIRLLYNEHECAFEDKLAYFLFLNQTCFNGLYRENRDGKFNVPHGKYTNPTVCHETQIWAAHELLDRVIILNGDFSTVGMNLENEEVFFYLDPPYRPIKENTSMFTSYNRSGFNDKKLNELKNMCHSINERGWHFMMSNSDSLKKNGDSYFDEAFGDFHIERMSVTRFINQYNATQRHPNEVLIMNY